MLGIIGGTGLSKLEIADNIKINPVITPFSGDPVEVHVGVVAGRPVAFLPRHGGLHKIPPHRINYRANIWALHAAGVTRLIAVNAVGGITSDLAPGVLAIPDQIIDYTSGRENSFFSDNLEEVVHIDFTHPYNEELRQTLLHCAAKLSPAITVVDGGVYGCMQGPRLETAAEIRRLERDGCTMVGMTGMPEAALARELEMDYAAIAVSVNRAAGLAPETITMASIYAVLETGMDEVRQLLKLCIGSLARSSGV
ncbi:MAG: S-methyl-5'-thioinosine phosphorylase [Pseudohongiellaceae bacterium]